MKPMRSVLSLSIAALFAAAPAFAGNTVTGSHAVASGGDLNTASGGYSAVGGGLSNAASGWYSSVPGGQGNTASGYASTALGLANVASAQDAIVAGGENNSAAGMNSIVAGGQYNQAGGDGSFAGGTSAVVRSAAQVGNSSGDQGTFVWSDAITVTTTYPPPCRDLTAPPCYETYTPTFSSTGPNQFLVRANGGFGLNTAPVNSNVAMTVQSTSGNPGYSSIFLVQGNSDNGMLISSGDASTGATNKANNAAFYIDQYNGSGQTRRLSIDGSGNFTVTAQAYKPGGGAWAASSDGRLKKNVQPLEHALDRLLALHGVTFEYSHPDGAMHPAGTFTGFIAQDVQPTFPNWIGHDAQGYLTVGPQGFEALTVEALREMKHDDDARIAKLEADNAALRKELADAVATQQAGLAELRREVAELGAAREAARVAVAGAMPQR